MSPSLAVVLVVKREKPTAGLCSTGSARKSKINTVCSRLSYVELLYLGSRGTATTAGCYPAEAGTDLPEDSIVMSSLGRRNSTSSSITVRSSTSAEP